MLAFVPLIILAGSIFIVVLPIILSGMTYNAFNYNRMKEFYIYLVLTFISILIALSLLGVLWDIESERITLIGAPPSPYTRKMISLLRYRHINYEIIWGDPGTILDSDEIFTNLNIEKPKPALLPTFILPNKDREMEAVTDSTPILRRFEKEYKERSVIPDNPVLSFLNFLLEDFGDEWATKYMFHYRWHFK